MAFMKVVAGKQKGKVVFVDNFTTEETVFDTDGNEHDVETLRPLTKEEEARCLKVEEIDLGL